MKPIGTNGKGPSRVKKKGLVGGPRTQGRIYAAIHQEVEEVPNIVMGTLSIFNKPAHVLIDPSAMHSFVFVVFALESDREVEMLSKELLIGTPVGETCVVSTMYQNCVIQIDGEKFTDNLIPLDIQEFDTILEVDFLFKYHTTIDCHQKKVVLQQLGGFKVIFKGDKKILPTCNILAIKASKLLRKGYMTYLAHVVDMHISKLKIEEIPVVQDSPNVFREELLGLSPNKEIELSIELIPVIVPISQTPYKMAPKGLKELKTRLQEFVDKRYVRPSVSLGVHYPYL